MGKNYQQFYNLQNKKDITLTATKKINRDDKANKISDKIN